MRHALDRRSLLRSGAAFALLGGVALVGCSSEDEQSSPAPATTPTPRRGGTLRAAFVGGGAAETLNFLKGPTPLDYVRARCAHGALGILDPAAEDGVRYEVLEGIDAADDLSVYTLRVRSGATFTDGSPLTAHDVLYSLNAPTTLGALPFLKPPAQNFDLAAARVTDDRTLELPTRAPIADGRLILCQSTLVFKDGTTAFTAGMPTCGPFRLTAFEAGQGSTFVRNDDYVGVAAGGGPYLDGLELRTIADSTARANALTGGQIDFAGDLGPVAARTLESNGRLRVVTSELPYATLLSFAMNLSFEPFADVRVRQAFKFAVDRQAILDTVLFGRGHLGNDLPGLGFTDYADELEQRPYDPNRARALLRDAGAEGLEVSLTTAPEISGMAETATLFVEQLKEVGVSAKLDQRPTGQLFSDFAAYVQLPFAASYSPPVPPLSSYASTRAGGAPSAFGFNRPDVDELVVKARSATSADERRAAAVEAQRIQWEEGNQIIPVFIPSINGQAPSVQGIVDDPFTNFSQAYLG
ncbi:solute-binding protein [Candidatus Protofrankia californiensis]|uniref:Solute-binding protein n=1 Tax=Candidatus Protofrankia californiensis TaxID=1839754 RepID=A0A1C3PG55_9ACTN|nr:ABC transporter substrate-binding protein [Protofrankia symbiont of Coriaria ruscifolia]SBW28822.1 solute-binding protein [Candidatus Protofrankia californiensis]